MPVCDDRWDLKDAWVVCRQLGFVSVVDFTQNSYFGNVGNWFSMRNVNCEGDENFLSECEHQKSAYCSIYDGAGVKCSTEVRSKNIPFLVFL